jgi:LacI family transcriptional regulator
MATQEQVARVARTSRKTVSRVINNEPLVNEKTRKRVLAVIEQLGYKPHQAARMMRSQESHIIGFLANEVATTWSSTALVSGAQDAAWKHGKQLMLFNVDEGGERERLALEQLQLYRAEAVIYATRYHRQVEIDGIPDAPLVLLNCFDAKQKYPAFVPDDYQAAFDITSEMIKRGAKRPVFLNLASSTVAGPLRAKGFVDAGKAAGLRLSGSVIQGATIEDGHYRFHGYEVAARILADGTKPDAILCGQDSLALQVYLAIAETGLRVGRDIAVASFDNEEPTCRLLVPGLSTMALPYYEMGYAAMEAALNPDMSSSQPKRLLCSLVNRDSLANESWAVREKRPGPYAR